jgi:hypothetical protein
MAELTTAVFAMCCIAQVCVVARVVSALEKRHPDQYSKLRGLGFWSRVHWFALTRADRGLGDPDLSERTIQLQVLMIVTLGSWLAGWAFQGHG